MPSASQRATVRESMSRLRKIHAACKKEKTAEGVEEHGKGSVSFQDLAQNVAQQIQQTREKIQERNSMVQKSHALDHDVILMSHGITKDILAIEGTMGALDGMLQESEKEMNEKMASMKKKYPKEEEIPQKVRGKVHALEKIVQERRGVCQSMRQCLADLQDLNAKRVTSDKKKGAVNASDASTELLQNKRTQLKDLLLMKQSGGDPNRANLYKSDGKSTSSGPTRIEDDPETRALMVEIKKNEAKIDAGLDMLLEGVKRLGEHAQNIQRELNEQTVIIEEVSNKMDETDEKLNNLNHRLKKITKSYRPHNALLTAGVIVLLLGLVGYLIQDLIRNKGV